MNALSLALSWLAAGTAMASGIATLRYRKLRYSQGWIEGRTAMLVSMNEAQQRGIPAEEWIRAEAHRDVANHLPILRDKLRDLGIELEEEDQ